MTYHAQTHSKRMLATLALVSLTASIPAHAFAPLSTDDSGTQGRGNSQLEIGYVFDRSTNLDTEVDNRVDNREFSSSLPMAFTYGVTDQIDVSLGLSHQLSKPRGWQNPELGVKWNFYGDASKGWSAALKPMLILPLSKSSQDKGLGNAKTNWGLALIGSYMADDYEVHANVKYTSNNQANTKDWEFEREHLWSASIMPVLVLNDQWKLGLDLGLRTNPSYNSATEAFTQVGLQYAPLENLQVGIGIGTAHAIGAESHDRSLSVATTLAYQF